MCMDGSRTIDSLLSEEASDQTTGLFPSRVFHSASIKPLYPIKVNGIMSRPRPFRGVLREEHSRQVFLFVWSGIKSLCVCERLLYIIHADTAIIGTTKPCVVCLAVVVCRYKQVTRLILPEFCWSCHPACSDLLRHSMMKLHCPWPHIPPKPLCSRISKTKSLVQTNTS